MLDHYGNLAEVLEPLIRDAEDEGTLREFISALIGFTEDLAVAASS
jgi:hypothetical protein